MLRHNLPHPFRGGAARLGSPELVEGLPSRSGAGLRLKTTVAYHAPPPTPSPEGEGAKAGASPETDGLDLMLSDMVHLANGVKGNRSNYRILGE